MKIGLLATACVIGIVAAMPGRSADAPAGDAPSLQLQWDARARHEQVSDDGFAHDARADTLRLRLGLLANFGAGWSGLLEGAGVASASGDYNSGANGHTEYPPITDPSGSELNQAWLAWKGAAFGATIGRQRIQLDNQRWIGNSGWRQFEQTFDAVTTQWQPVTGWTLRYDWLGRVHRVAGPDALNALARARSLDTHLFNTSYVQGGQQWTAYLYLHDDRDVASASTATAGFRWTGTPPASVEGFGWVLEAARQSDYVANPQHYTRSYWLLEPAYTLVGITGALGWEHLGGNGRNAVQTPLATLHAFNGWDDQFLVTPLDGLNDRYATLNGKFGTSGWRGKLAWIVSWHDFRSSHASIRYGSECDASLALPFSKNLVALVKAASYRADGFGRDDTKLWLQLEWHGLQALLH
jgi:hypothetical protein